MLRTLVSSALAFAVLACSGTPARAASEAGLPCVGSKPVGDFLGIVRRGGKQFTALNAAVLKLSAKNGAPFGWLYLDQFGIRWIQFDKLPDGISSGDVGGASAGQEPAALPDTRMFNPATTSLTRCDKDT